jgi:hypothetical protein
MREGTGHRIIVGFIAAATAVAAGCSDNRDPRFAAETYDEYTEPLVNAVIGTPDGTITIDESGARTVTPAALVAAPAKGNGRAGAGGHAAGGTTGAGGAVTGVGGLAMGGSFGAGGSNTGGSFNTGGTFGETGGTFGNTGGTFGGAGFGGGGSFGMGGGGGSNSGGGFGFWHFDDCSPTSHFLTDSSGFGATAQQPLKAACVSGISGLGVQIRSAKDVVQVPDEPQFTVSNRVAVAAWVNPTTVSGNQPIIIKRLNNQTSFSLGIHNGNIEMSVVLTTGKTVISSAPISPGVWTHVAGMFDGTFVFLFINGQQFGQVYGAGTLQNVFAPLRFGATTQSQYLNGIIDEVFVSTQAITKDQLAALSCISRPTTMSVNPLTSPPTPFDTSTHFDVAVTDNDIGGCGEKDYNMFFNFFDPTLNINFQDSFQPAFPGQTVTFSLDITPTEDADPGLHQLPFVVDAFTNFNGGFEQLNGQMNLDVQAPTGCFVFTKRELMITNTSVVDDPVRTTGDGAWSFGHVMRQLAPTPDQAPAMALALFQHWLTDQQVNGFTVAARPGMQQQILDQWPKTPTGDLDLDNAPFALQAIVNRFDLRDESKGSAGEGRLVYAFTPPGSPFGQEFTVILEYNLPITANRSATDWANAWHALSANTFPSADYNTALEAITRSFTERTENGVNLMQLRTNDFVTAFFTRWELREFQLSATTGFFDEVTVKETPDLSFNNTQTFSDFVNQNADAIKAVIPGAPSSTVPPQFENAPFLAGSIFNDLIVWNGPGIADSDARFHASINTCNGCHGPDTNTGFLMVFPRVIGSEASLSGFLTGTTAFDQFTGQQRTLNDLGRRKDDLTNVVCAPTGMAPVAAK